MSLSNGRSYLAIPGPSVMPDRVLQAMHQASPNIYEGELVDLMDGIVADLKAVARTRENVAIYIGNGHAAWEAALANVVAPGDTVLVLATGRFGIGWSEIAEGLGAKVEIIDFGVQSAIDLSRAEAVLAADEDAKEGTLAPRFNALVRKETCADVARQIDLGAVLKLGRSEMQSGGRRKDALLGDAVEAVIAAIYFDAGLDAARAFILTHWGARIKSAESHVSNSKSELQEWAQGRAMVPPIYSEVSREGPPHAPQFVIQVALADGRSAQARAGSKRAAEQAAAAALFQKVNTNV